jgi:D,D-heptose 1,7-bisphosphate phosphatase
MSDTTVEWSKNPRRAVLLDRDGTLLKDPGYLSDPDGIVFFPDVVDSLKLLQDAGYLLIVLTNQSGIGRGYFNEETGIAVNLRMADILREKGVDLIGIYYCRHHPDEGCRCRKPGTLMAERALSDLGIQARSSWMVGDTSKDVLMGMNAGLRPVLLTTGKLPKEEAPARIPVKKDLKEAVNHILDQEVP